MTVIHIVLFKFKPSVSATHKATFVQQLKSLKKLPCVLDNKLIVGGPSVTDPPERSKGYEFALLSFHQDRQALEAYQASDEHHRVTSELLWPYKEDVIRFDFEVAKEDEHMFEVFANGLLAGSCVTDAA